MSQLLLENSASMPKEWSEDSRLLQLKNEQVTRLLGNRSFERKLRKDKPFYDSVDKSSETTVKHRLSYEISNA